MPRKPPEDEFERELGKWAALESEGHISPEARRRISDALSASLVPVKHLPSETSLVLTFFLVFAAFAGGLIAVGDKAGFHLMTMAQMVSMAAIFAAGAGFFSFALARQMIPGSRHSFPVAIALTIWGVAVAGGVIRLFPWRSLTAFVAEGWPCAATELIIAIPSIGLFWLLARRGALFPSASLSATLVGLASTLALLVLQFRCMFQNAPHLLAWHGLTAAALIGFGAFTGLIYRHFQNYPATQGADPR